MSTILGLRAATRRCTKRTLIRDTRLVISFNDQPPCGRRTFFGVGESITYASLALSKKIIWTTIGANVAVFGAWQYARANNGLEPPRRSSSWSSMWRSGREKAQATAAQRMGQLLNQNFIMRAEDVKKGKWWTTITSAFSHMEPYHIIGNMFTLHAFATVLVYSGLPPQALVALMFGSALSGSLGYLWHERSASNGRSFASGGALGASGMVMGLGAAAAFTRPFVNLQLMGIIPVPMWLIFAGYTYYDTYYLDHPMSRTGHAAHLGGGAFGVAFYLLFLRRLGGPLGM